MASDDDTPCTFCSIARSIPPIPPKLPSSPVPNAVSEHSPEAHVVLSTPTVFAILDHQPLTTGHTLLLLRRHARTLAEVSPVEAEELGRWLPLLSRAVCAATGREAWNVVQNNGLAAAQLIDHVHFHIVPRGGQDGQGGLGAATGVQRTAIMFGRGPREDLDEDEGRTLAARIRAELARVLVEEDHRQQKDGEGKPTRLRERHGSKL